MSVRPAFGDVPRRLSDQVASFLREEIYSGHLRPGQRLPEVELCERLNVSRAPLREAILALRTDGLVDVLPHRGATVTKLTDDDIREVFALRQRLEPFGARVAAARRDPEALVQIEDALDGIRTAVLGKRPLPIALAHASFHRAVAQASGMARLVSFVDVLSTQMLASHGVGYAASPASVATIAAEHEPILAAIRDGDEAAAEERMLAHFSPVEPMLEAYHRLVDDRRADGASREDGIAPSNGRS